MLYSTNMSLLVLLTPTVHVYYTFIRFSDPLPRRSYSSDRGELLLLKMSLKVQIVPLDITVRAFPCETRGSPAVLRNSPDRTGYIHDVRPVETVFVRG